MGPVPAVLSSESTVPAVLAGFAAKSGQSTTHTRIVRHGTPWPAAVAPIDNAPFWWRKGSKCDSLHRSGEVPVSLGIAFKGSEGLVLAADSRVTISAQAIDPTTGAVVVIPATYDNATKLLTLRGQKHVAALTYGLGSIGFPAPRTVHGLLPEFEAALGHQAQRMTVVDFAQHLSDFIAAQWVQRMPAGIVAPDLFFMVGGYNDNEPYGRVYEFNIPSAPAPVEQIVDDFGMRWGGQNEVISRMLNGHDPALMNLLKTKFNLTDPDTANLANEITGVSAARIPYQFLPLQDCVDLSILLVRTTIQLMEYQTSLRGVGGAIDVATITQEEGLNYVQRKQIRGELSSLSGVP
jgi:hypothetical protein